MKIYYIIYETTNLINNKKYRGIHKTLELEDGYIGSGKIFTQAVKKYGKINFKREILEFCSSYEELMEKEKIYVNKEWINNRMNYNLIIGGQIQDDVCREKISETLKERFKNTEHNRKGMEPWNKNKKGVQSAWNKGLKLGPQSQESKDKKSKTLKERYKNEVHHSKGKEPWNKGKKGSQVPWNKGKIMEKIECPHCGKLCDKLNAKKWHFDNCKNKPNIGNIII